MTQYGTMDIVHASQQFSDPDSAHRADAHTLFEFCRNNDIRIVTGTETASDSMWNLIHDAAHEFGYVIRRRESCWVAARRTVVKDVIDAGYIPVISGDSYQSVRDHGPRGIAWMEYRDKDFGIVTVGSMHALTRGAKPGDPNYQANQKFGPATTEFGREHGKGRQLCFLNGDGNAVDRIRDVYHGGPFTTAWDDLEKWPDTHPTAGNIDFIGGYNADGRVNWVKAWAYDDSKIYLHADHYIIRAKALIRL